MKNISRSCEAVPVFTMSLSSWCTRCAHLPNHSPDLAAAAFISLSWMGLSANVFYTRCLSPAMPFTISHTNARSFHSESRKCLSGTLEGLNCVFIFVVIFFLNVTTGKHWIMKQNPRNTHVSYDFSFQLVLIFWYDQFYYSYNGSILTYTITCKPNSDSAMWGEKLFVCWWRELGTKHIHHFSAFIL